MNREGDQVVALQFTPYLVPTAGNKQVFASWPSSPHSEQLDVFLALMVMPNLTVSRLKRPVRAL